MKTMLKALSLATILAAASHVALADTINGTISLSGPGSFTVTGTVGAFTVTAPDTQHFNAVTSDTGTFLDFDGAVSANITFDSFTTNESVPAEIFHITMPSGEKLTFTASGFSGLEGPGASSAGSVNITGTIAIANAGTTVYAPASGILDFAANGQLLNFTESTLTTGRGSLSSVPEPGSLFLLGSGMLAAAGFGRRKFNI